MMYNTKFTRVFNIRPNNEPEYLPRTGVEILGKDRIVIFAPVEDYVDLVMSGAIVMGKGFHITHARCGNPTIYNEEYVIAKAKYPLIVDWWLKHPSALSPADEHRINIYIEFECAEVELCGF